MPRRRVAKKREISPDPKFHNKTVSMLAHRIMECGKKALAFKIVYGAFDQIAKQLHDRFTKTQLLELEKAVEKKGDDTKEKNLTNIPLEKMPLVIFEKSLENIKPVVEVQARRVGGGTYQIPRPVPSARRTSLALRFLKKAALVRKKSVTFSPSDKNMMTKLLALEIMDAYENKGGAVKICQDMHRMAKANQAYVHFRLSSK
jgi:small subunit ribosomal protein S7